MAENVPSNPYLGPTAFTEDDSARFFGRVDETEELAGLVVARRAVLLYAQSGAGKTSLLQAGLIPELKLRNHLETFPIARVMGGVEAAGNVYVENALSHLFPSVRAGALSGETFTSAFASLLKAGAAAPRQPRLIIFDQFEEIFTFHPEETEQRCAFFEQLGECLASYPQLSLLLSMREEYLADLETYTALLPDRVRARMRLERLGTESAVEAIREPAAWGGMPFAAGAAEELVDNLRRVRTGSAAKKGFALGDYVEPVQLQIVCRQLWSRLAEDQSRARTEIDSADIEQYANVDGALTRFYRDSLAKAQQTGVTERALRRWFRERLITPAGTRGLVYRGESETEGLPNAAVDILRECYIIRAELRGGNVWYELAHDRLVEPVREDNRNWRLNYRNPIAEAMERGADNLLVGKGLVEGLRYAKENPQELTPEEEAFLKKSSTEEKKAKARRRTLVGSALAVMLTLSVIAGWAVVEARRAHKQEAVAIANAREAERQREAAKKQEERAKRNASEAETQRNRAEEQKTLADAARANAQSQATAASAEKLAAEALLNKADDVDLAALLSIEGRRAADTFQTRGSLLSTLVQAIQDRVISVLHEDGPLTCEAFSPDGKLLAAAGERGTIRIWNVASRQPSGEPLKGYAKSINISSIEFSPDGKLLASGADNGTILLWDVGLRRLSGEPMKGYGPIAFSPDGKLLASLGLDIKQVLFWDVATHKPMGDYVEQQDPVSTIAFSPNGRLLASAGMEKTIRLWDVATRKQLGDPLKGHSKSVDTVAFSPDGKLLASAGTDATLRLWDVATQQPLGGPLEVNDESVLSVAFSPNGRLVAAAGFNKKIFLWDVSTHRQLIDPLKGHSDLVFSVKFSRDGLVLASASRDETVRLWDVAPRQPQLGDSLKGHAKQVESVAFSPNGKLLASAGQDKTVRLWDVANHRALGNPLEGHSDMVWSVTFSPDGKLLASASADKTIRLWDVMTHRELGDPIKGQSPLDFLQGVKFSPDGKLLAMAGDSLRLWDLGRRQPVGEPFETNVGVLHDTAFSPDGKLLASATIFDGKVRLWDLNKRQFVGRPLRGERAVAFSPDGKLLASGADDTSVRLWDVASQRLMGAPLETEAGGATSLAYSPDGKLLASGAADATVQLWDVDPNSWTVRLCQIANRNMSMTEWKQFVGPNVPYHRTCPNLPAH